MVALLAFVLCGLSGVLWAVCDTPQERATVRPLATILVGTALILLTVVVGIALGRL